MKWPTAQQPLAGNTAALRVATKGPGTLQLTVCTGRGTQQDLLPYFSSFRSGSFQSWPKHHAWEASLSSQVGSDLCSVTPRPCEPPPPGGLQLSTWPSSTCWLVFHPTMAGSCAWGGGAPCPVLVHSCKHACIHSFIPSRMPTPHQALGTR